MNCVAWLNGREHFTSDNESLVCPDKMMISFLRKHRYWVSDHNFDLPGRAKGGEAVQCVHRSPGCHSLWKCTGCQSRHEATEKVLQGSGRTLFLTQRGVPKLYGQEYQIHSRHLPSGTVKGQPIKPSLQAEVPHTHCQKLERRPIWFRACRGSRGCLMHQSNQRESQKQLLHPLGCHWRGAPAMELFIRSGPNT